MVPLRLAGLDDDAIAAIDDRTLTVIERRRRRTKAHSRGWLIRRMLLLADGFGLLAAGLVVLAVFGGGQTTIAAQFALFILALPIWVVAAKLQGLYDRDEERADYSTADDLLGVVHLLTFGVWIAYLIGAASGIVEPGLWKVASFWGLGIVFVTASRVMARSWCRHRLEYLQNTIIVGAGEVGQLVARKLQQHPEYGLNLVGFVDLRPRDRRSDISELPLLGSPEHLSDIIRSLEIERVVVAFSNEAESATLELVRSLHELDVQVDVVPRLYELVGPRVGVHTVEGLPLIGLPPVRLSPSSQLVKRVIDIIGASFLLLVTGPLFITIAILVKRDSPGPVFFRQTRLGLNMKPFTALKFRTMKCDTDDAPHRAYIEEVMSAGSETNGNGIYKLDRPDAVTKVGKWLRKTSLDELPQLLNVLRGDMSLVGPRPCIEYELAYFAPHHFERFHVPAGLTGLWQVTARAHSTFGEALEMDVAYARGWSLGLDLRLLFRTPIELLRHRNGGTA
jgi:exopolysaccharide biosynthesis polyprenyl glycosylphosphotransferase